MTVRSIQAQGAAGYADYLESKTVAPEQGDYYLGRDGEPAEAPGRWLARPGTLRAIGIEPGQPVAREQLVALMEGRWPGADLHMRPAGPDGTRSAGLDMVLSAPKSVSIAWALADDDTRAAIEAVHHEAVERTMRHIVAQVPLTTRRVDGRNVEVPAADVIAAEFRHSTSRGLQGRVPDPQLHSHVVATCVVRHDGRYAAVRHRPAFRAAREGGAYYRAALADGLERAGYTIERRTGKHGRYFELAGVGEKTIDAFSGRAREIERIVRKFEARHGRRPSEIELQLIKVDSRSDKLPHTRGELRSAWQQTAATYGQRELAPHPGASRVPVSDASWTTEVEHALHAERATFSESILRATALENAAGVMGPDTALAQVHTMRATGDLLKLDNGTLTTRRMRALETSITDRTRQMSHPQPGQRGLSQRLLRAAHDQVSERIGASLSVEQQQAVTTLTGPERIAALEGQAGTGKGVVIDAVARAERMARRTPIGVAVAGATAQRLGQESPALDGRTTTIASLLARHGHAGQEINPDTTVIVDEAGMIDTPTLERLVRTVDDAGGKLIVVGDGKQLPAIGPGGMFDQLTRDAPRASLTVVRRTADPDERKAWRALRDGRPEKAMAHYLARGRLHLTEDRDAALQAAVRRYDELTATHGIEGVALMTDGSTQEVERMNARVQHLRLERHEVGTRSVAIPAHDADAALHYELRQGDLVTWRSIQVVPQDARIENGSRGIVTAVDEHVQQLHVTLTGSGREVTVAGADLSNLRLGYAQHVVRQQGATVDRAIAVTGGWQSSRESAYVQASRARQGIDWYAGRDQLDDDGADLDKLQTLAAADTKRIERLAAQMAESRSKTPSIEHDLTPAADTRPRWEPGLDPIASPSLDSPILSQLALPFPDLSTDIDP